MNVGTLTGYLELVDNATPELKKFQSQLATIGQSMKQAGTALTLSVTAPLVGAATASLALSGTFDQTMKRLVSIAGVSQSELAGVRKEILEMAPAVGIGPQMLANAMIKVSSTVEDTGRAMSILKIAAQGTKAGFGDTIDVAGALTAVLNSYASTNLTAARAGDILAQAIKSGGSEAKELAPTLSNVVPFAAILGVTFEEVAANLATMTKLGVPTTEAVTTLTSVFTALSRESKQGQDALEGLGLTYKQLREDMTDNGLAAMLSHLMEASGGSVTILSDVFGRIEALRNIMGTAGVQGDTYRHVLDDVKNSSNAAGGALKAMADAMNGTQIQTWNELKAAVQVTAIQLGDALAPSFIEVLDAAKPLLPVAQGLVKAFTDLPQPVQTTAIGMLGLAAGLGPALYAIGGISLGVKALVPLVAGMGGAFALATGPVGLIAFAVLGLVAAVVKFEIEMGNLARMPKTGNLEGLKDGAGQAMIPLSELEERLKITAKTGNVLTAQFDKLVMSEAEVAAAADFAANQTKAQIAAAKAAAKELEEYRQKIMGINIAEQSHVNLLAKMVAGGFQEAAVFGRVAAAAGEMLRSGQKVPDLLKDWYTKAMNLGGLMTGGFTKGLIDANEQIPMFNSGIGETAVILTDYAMRQANATRMLHEFVKLPEGLGEDIGFVNSGFGETAKVLDGVALKTDVWNKRQAEANRLLHEGDHEVKKFSDILKSGLMENLKKIPDVLISSLTGGGGVLGGAMAIGSMVGSTIGQSVGLSISKALTGLGSLAGPIGGAIGSLLGPLIGMIANIGGPSKAELGARDLQKGVIDSFRAAGIAGDNFEVILRGVSKAIMNIGGSAEDARLLTEKLLDTGHPETYKSAIEELNKVMAQEKLQIEGTANAVVALNEGTKEGITNQGDFNREASTAVTLFDEMVRRNGDVLAAFSALDPVLDQLVIGENEFGLQGNAAIEQLLRMRDVTIEHEGLFNAIKMNTAIIGGLGQASLLTATNIIALGQNAVNHFSLLTDVTGDSREAMVLMQPELQKLWEYQEKYGEFADAATEAMVNQAREQGLVGPDMMSTNEQLLKVMKDIRDVIAEATGHTKDFGDAIDDLPTEHRTRLIVDEETNPRDSRSPEYAADGLYVPRGSDTVHAMVGEDERVLTSAQNDAYERGLQPSNADVVAAITDLPDALAPKLSRALARAVSIELASLRTAS